MTLAALRARQPEALARFRDVALPKLTGLCRRWLQSEALADEVAHDVWLDFVLRYLDEVQRPGAVNAYLQVMAARRCVRLRRQRARQVVQADSDGEGGAQRVATLPVDGLHEAEVRLEMRGVERCMDRLAPASRRMLRLRFHGDHTQEEIGAAMGTSKQYVGRVLQKSLEALRRCLKDAS